MRVQEVQAVDASFSPPLSLGTCRERHGLNERVPGEETCMKPVLTSQPGRRVPLGEIRIFHEPWIWGVT